MSAVDKALLTDLLDGMSGIHQYLLDDLSNEKLSIENQQKRQQFIQWTKSFMQRIQSTHPSIRPRVNTPGKLPPRPPPQQVAQKPIPSAYKPPPPIPVEEEPQDVYEVPEKTEQEEDDEDYLPVEPVHAEEPQEDYLAMEGDEGRIEEETYEDPTQTIQDESQGLYEEAVSHNQMVPPIQITTSPPNSVALQQSHDPTGYMDPLQLNIGEDDKRASLIPEDLIDDWEFAYDKSTAKKREKLKVSDLKNVVIKGWLEKLGGRNQKSWQKRFCVLSDIFMYFYEKETSNTYNNRIPMPGFVPNPVNDLTKPKKNQFAFKLSAITDNGLLKDYYFRSRTDEERNGWIESIRKIAEIGRGEIEKRKSMTLPSSSHRHMPEATPVSTTTRSLTSPQEILEDDPCENYEALEPALIEPDQEDYVDVTPSNEKDSLSQEPQESYVELEPSNQETFEEPQDYVEAEEVRPPRPAKYVPPSTATQLPLPPPPTAQTVPPPVPAHSPARPDPIVDTSKIYMQQNGGIEYNRVFVVLWDFITSESDELNLQRGDLVFVSEPKTGQEWWYGELLDKDASKKLGPCGLFPSNYSSNAFELISS